MVWGMLGGCASQVLSIHTLPDETPAADNAAATASAAAVFAAPAKAPAAAAVAQHPAVGEPAAAPPVTPADAPSMYTYDPLERANRFFYRFDYRFDEAVFLPVVRTYERIPGPLRSGVHNFFGNLSEIDSVINYVLQWRLKFGLRSLERLVINSTIGIGGLFDVAGHWKLAAEPTGFATTLSEWGMHPGAFLVLPVLGPSTVRDGSGYAVDYATLYGIDVFHLYRGDASWGLGATNTVDQRAHIDFRYYSTGSPFEYENIRFLYVRRRLIEDEALHAHEPRKRPQPDEPAGK
jgi:phospholipid-binding lipoprotein MlaA